jgi:hypothetical protein
MFLDLDHLVYGLYEYDFYLTESQGDYLFNNNKEYKWLS